MTPTTIPEQVPTRTAPLEPETREPLEPRVRTASDVLFGAARIIEERGWWQAGRPETANGQCVMTAINKAAVGDVALESQALWLLRRSLGILPDWPDTWNDAPDRTEAEVIRALRDAAR